MVTKKQPFWYDKSFILTLVFIGAAVTLILTGHVKLTEELLASLLPALTGGYMAGKRGWLQRTPKDRKEVLPEDGDKEDKEDEEKEAEEEKPPAA